MAGHCPKKCSTVSSDSSQFGHILEWERLMLKRCLLSDNSVQRPLIFIASLYVQSFGRKVSSPKFQHSWRDNWLRDSVFGKRMAVYIFIKCGLSNID